MFLMNISPANIFFNMFFPAIFHQNCEAVLAAASINGLREKCEYKARLPT